MATGVRIGLIVVALLLLGALVFAGFLLFERGRVASEGGEDGPPLAREGRIDQEPQGELETEPEAAAEAAVSSEGPVAEVRVPEDALSGLGTIEVWVEQVGARVAVIGPDRYFHANAGFGGVSLGRLASGRYIVVGTLEGYRATAQEIEVTAGQVSSLSLDLRQAGGN